MDNQKYDNKFHLFFRSNQMILIEQNYNVFLGILVEWIKKKLIYGSAF